MSELTPVFSVTSAVSCTGGYFGSKVKPNSDLDSPPANVVDKSGSGLEKASCEALAPASPAAPSLGKKRPFAAFAASEKAFKLASDTAGVALAQDLDMEEPHADEPAHEVKDLVMDDAVEEVEAKTGDDEAVDAAAGNQAAVEIAPSGEGKRKSKKIAAGSKKPAKKKQKLSKKARSSSSKNHGGSDQVCAPVRSLCLNL